MNDPVFASEQSPAPPAALSRGARATVVVCVAIMAVTAAFDGWLIAQRVRYTREIDRLRASMSDLERRRADQIVSNEQNKLLVGLELLRRQAQIEPTLHLAVAVDSGKMYLEREGAILREMPVGVGPERTVGVPPDTVRIAAPRGVRAIVRILGDADAWEVPDWVYRERGIAVAAGSVPGALGPIAIVLEGGTIIYAMPATGPLSDSTYVMPGAVRAAESDLAAVRPNLQPGMLVYFY